MIRFRLFLVLGLLSLPFYLQGRDLAKTLEEYKPSLITALCMGNTYSQTQYPVYAGKSDSEVMSALFTKVFQAKVHSGHNLKLQGFKDLFQIAIADLPEDHLFIFYFSGHSNVSGALRMEDHYIHLDEWRSLINQISNPTVIILDRSYEGSGPSKEVLVTEGFRKNVMFLTSALTSINHKEIALARNQEPFWSLEKVVNNYLEQDPALMGIFTLGLVQFFNVFPEFGFTSIAWSDWIETATPTIKYLASRYGHREIILHPRAGRMYVHDHQLPILYPENPRSDFFENPLYNHMLTLKKK